MIEKFLEKRRDLFRSMRKDIGMNSNLVVLTDEINWLGQKIISRISVL